MGTHETGGCGEDWWHPGCVVGLGPKWFENMSTDKVKAEVKEEDGPLPTIAEDGETPQNCEAGAGEDEAEDDDDPPPPPGFPADDDFESFLCYKCVEAHPWIRRYAGAPGFLPPVFYKPAEAGQEFAPAVKTEDPPAASNGDSSKKRKAEDDEEEFETTKRQKSEAPTPPEPTSEPVPTDAPTSATPTDPTTATTTTCKLTTLPPSPKGTFSLFLLPTFRAHLCHCPSCFPLLTPHPQLLEEEETYEPPVSEPSEHNAPSSVSGGSLYDRGESALRNNVDRVRAIEGVMAYQHLKDRLMPFFREFAERGEAISAEDVKEYFAKLRGDDGAIREAGERVEREGGQGGGEGGGNGGGEKGFREGQSGY